MKGIFTALYSAPIRYGTACLLCAGAATLAFAPIKSTNLETSMNPATTSDAEHGGQPERRAQPEHAAQPKLDIDRLLTAFDQSRLPAPVQTVKRREPVKVDPLAQISLFGVVRSDTEVIAILNVNGKRARLNVGDKVNGAEIVEINTDSVTFRVDERPRTIRLAS